MCQFRWFNIAAGVLVGMTGYGLKIFYSTNETSVMLNFTSIEKFHVALASL